MDAPPLTWAVRVLWLTLPVTLGALFGWSLEDRSRPVALVVVALAWALWGVGLVAALVTRPLALVVLRVVVPTAPLAGAVAVVAGGNNSDGGPGALGWVGLGCAAAAAALAMSATVGDAYVDGDSYGDERRFALRPPALLLFGPVPLLWALGAVPLLVGAVLLAARAWLPGAVLLAVGVVAAAYAFRVLARLVRRFAVLVPAGLTVVDDLALAEPTLFRRDRMVRLGPAPVGTDAVDLSAGATGLLVEVAMSAPLAVLPAAGRGRAAEAVDTAAVLIAPTRPGALLAESEQRRLPVGRS